MAKLTRLATTVTARYYPAPDLIDAFFMDGRLSGKREARSADITLDKEERGFMFSVFSHAVTPGRDPAAPPPFEPPLRKFLDEIKLGKRALDDQIGEFVNTSVAVTGRMRLSAENVRTPFFAGIMIKDSEAFAITMGRGLAFLYRDDTLFPLTATDIAIEPVNTERQQVDNFYNYCASKTATALYSNIAQLRMDDCFILCNREVYDALGQQEILRILYDAEDQSDAASMVITEAAAKLPGVPLQFMIAFVESVAAQEKSGFFGFGKKNKQQSYNEAEDEAIEIPMAGSVPLVGETPVAEPLYFGNEQSNPQAQPRVEQPVTPLGADEPIQFEDQTLAPFGAPIEAVEPKVDEGGFVVSEPPLEEPIHSFSAEELAAISTEPEPSLSSSETILASPVPEEPSFKAPFQYIPESESPTVSTGEELLFGDVKPEPEVPVAPIVPEEKVIPPVPAVSTPTPSQSIPQFFQDPVSDEDVKVILPKDESQGFSPFVKPADEIDNAVPGGTKDTDSSSYFIPFETAETPTTKAASAEDIPDMPLYEPPSYTPPTYPANSYMPNGYDNVGVYSRGAYSLENEEESFSFPTQGTTPKEDSFNFPPQGAASKEDGFTYQPPRQTIPPYGATPKYRQSDSGYHPSRTAPHSQSADRQVNSHSGRQPMPPRHTQRRAPQDVFDQEQELEYGAPDRAYNRNKILMIVLAGICIVCLIALIYFAVSNNKKGTEPVATTAASVTSGTTAPTAAPSETAVPPAGNVPENAEKVFTFGDALGTRTWWDLFNTAYGITLEKDTDPKIAKLIAFNNLPADFKPKAGDRIYLPEKSYFEAAATASESTTTSSSAAT